MGLPISFPVGFPAAVDLCQSSINRCDSIWRSRLPLHPQKMSWTIVILAKSSACQSTRRKLVVLLVLRPQMSGVCWFRFTLPMSQTHPGMIFARRFDHRRDTLPRSGRVVKWYVSIVLIIQIPCAQCSSILHPFYIHLRSRTSERSQHMKHVGMDELLSKRRVLRVFFGLPGFVKRFDAWEFFMSLELDQGI